MLAARGQRFDPADAGDPADRAADPADDALHDAEMVEDRHQGREEDDHGQGLDGEILAELVGGEAAEQEGGALAGITEQVRDAARHRLDRGAAPARIDDEHGDSGLEREGGGDDSRADRAPVRRQQECNAQDGDDAGNAEQITIHVPSPRAWLLPDHLLFGGADRDVQLVKRLVDRVGDDQLGAPRVGDMKPLCVTWSINSTRLSQKPPTLSRAKGLA